MRRTGFVVTAVSGFALMVGMAANAAQEGEKSPLSAMFACASVKDDAKRLACYDTEAARLKQASDTGDVVTVNQEQIQNLQKEAFGFSLPSLPKLRVPLLAGMLGNGDGKKAEVSQDKLSDAKSDNGAVLAVKKNGEITKVGYAIARIGSTADGSYRFYLQNGQVWDQVQGGRSYIPRPRNGRTLIAEIRKASMGSYLLTVDGRGAAIRVRRVK